VLCVYTYKKAAKKVVGLFFFKKNSAAPHWEWILLFGLDVLVILHILFRVRVLMARRRPSGWVFF
jgi:hypothetical protein